MLEVGNETALMAQPASPPKWTGEAAWSVYRLPFNDLLFRAQSIHRRFQRIRKNDTGHKGSWRADFVQ